MDDEFERRAVLGRLLARDNALEMVRGRLSTIEQMLRLRHRGNDLYSGRYHRVFSFNTRQ